MPKSTWTIEQVKRNIHVVRCSANVPKWEQWVLLMSDEHWDNPACNWTMLADHHKEAVKRNALILKFGDTFCAMQGKYDKRSDKGSVRPEHQDGDYLDALVRTAAEWYRPYGKHIGMVGLGNHETAILNRHETCLITRLCERLRDKGSIATPGGYTGWVRFMTCRNHGSNLSLKLWYNHGAGGGGPVTKGIIDFNRYAEYVDADIFVAGHIHRRMYYPTVRLRLTDSHAHRADTMHIIRCGPYKEDFGDGHGGWHVEKAMGPRPLGGWWLRLYLDRQHRRGGDTTLFKAEVRDVI